jgi:sugar/nucleoside kinase (ribokinase family)
MALEVHRTLCSERFVCLRNTRSKVRREMSTESKLHKWDCVVCGEVCVDIPVRPVPRNVRLDATANTISVGPIDLGAGGIVSNSGMAMSRLGLRTTALAHVGSDLWGPVLRNMFESEGLNCDHLIRDADHRTSATVVLVDESGEHTFAFHAGASKLFGRETIVDNLPVFAESRFALLGYYGLFNDACENDLPELIGEIRSTGCRVAMDTAGGGGALQPLDRILPTLDYYIPSYTEAHSQTGETEPRKMIETYRRYTSDTVLGIKLGAQGVLLSRSAGDWLEIAPVSPPASVVDTTGAGDSFFAGLIAGLCHDLPLEEAARIGAATGACSVTGISGVTAIRSFDETRKLLDC